MIWNRYGEEAKHCGASSPGVAVEESWTCLTFNCLLVVLYSLRVLLHTACFALPYWEEVKQCGRVEPTSLGGLTRPTSPSDEGLSRAQTNAMTAGMTELDDARWACPRRTWRERLKVRIICGQSNIQFTRPKTTTWKKTSVASQTCSDSPEKQFAFSIRAENHLLLGRITTYLTGRARLLPRCGLRASELNI